MPLTNSPAMYLSDSSAKDRFTEEYRKSLFYQWYDNDKPSAETFMRMIKPDPATGAVPSRPTMEKWIRYEWPSRAAIIDQRTIETMDQTMVEHKLERLQRHAELGKEMQQIGIEYLREHGLGSAKNALTALIRGIQIERDSLSVPKFLEDLDKLSDADLIEEMRKLAHETGPMIDLDAKDADLDA